MSRPANGRRDSPAAELLGPNGPLARAMTGYEAREGQLRMAASVERALAEDRVLLCEAGTGTGKTLAYLVPAILSGRKIVVSTATRALQEQIFYKDLPLIREALGLEPRAALMKGLSNYLCLRRYHTLRSGGAHPPADGALAAIERWAAETTSGDVSEMGDLAEDDPLLPLVTSSSETRVGAACTYFRECFVSRMKQTAESAQLLVVNHHLFFADLALRGPHPGRVLPDYDAVIFDEAHQLEDVATTFFGVRISAARLERLVRELEQALGVAVATRRLPDERLSPALASARTAAERFWRELRRGTEAGEGRTVVHGDFWAGSSRDAYHELDSALEALAAVAETASSRVSSSSGAASLPVSPPAGRRPQTGPGGVSRTMLADAFDVARRRSQLLRDELAAVVDGAPGRIAWFERDAKKAALSSSPVDVSGIFRDHVFDRIPAVVLTSATLSSGAAPSAPPDALEVPQSQKPQFRFLRSRLGLDGPDASPLELLVESPFDFESRALLYVPDDLPAPGEDGFSEAASDRIVELVELTGGGAFVLATSVRAMRRLYQALRARLSGALVLVQGEAPKSTLIALFKEHGNAVLVATLSFWQGVDVPGAALRLVVLDKIPFPVPSDPIVTARSQALAESGRNAFMELHVPLAQITLKQGFGRLIRSRTDSGIVALFDPRVHRRGYGRRLIGALPKARTVRRLEEVRAFWEGLAPGAVQAS